MVSQKQAVYDAVQAFCSENNIPFEDNMRFEFDREQRATIIGMLIAFTEAGEVEVKSESARSDLKKYWNGTLTNWLRKDPRLNGGIKNPQPKNPGSRAGAGDSQLKAMKRLHARLVATPVSEDFSEEKKADSIAAVEAEIEKRKSEIAASKIKKQEIDVESLPEHLRHLA